MENIMAGMGRTGHKDTARIVRWTLFSLYLLALFGTVFLVGVQAAGKASLSRKAQTFAPEPVQGQQQEIPGQLKEQWQEGWIRYQGKIYAYNEDIRTFLIMGIDKDSEVEQAQGGVNGGQADALFLAVMNPHGESLQIIGINRNTMTDVDVYDEEGAFVTTMPAQIAVQHGFGDGMEESCAYQVKAVSRLFYGLPIHGYAAVNMSAISTINDAVGGVDVTVLEDLTGKDSALVRGEQVHLMGESAFWYVKYRSTEAFGSSDMRLERQKQYLNALIGTAREAFRKDFTVAVRLYQAVASRMVTDISLDEVLYLAPLLADYTFDGESFYLLRGENVMGEQFEEFYVDEQALYEMVLEIFYEEVENE